jgi:hypothetical protein
MCPATATLATEDDGMGNHEGTVTTDIQEQEIIRARWRRARDRLLLNDPDAPDFGAGGLVSVAPDVGVRLLVLPPDPEAVVVDFDADFWPWWEQDRPNPFGGPPTDWGGRSTPTVDAAARFERYTDDRWRWERYLALHRHGGLEAGMGREVVGVWSRSHEGPQARVFRLVPIVGRVWCLLALYAEVIQRYKLGGPWEVSLALRETAGSVFGNVGAGWAEPTDAWPDEVRACPNPNVLIVREVPEWPYEDAARDFAFLLGACLEDTWGVRERRFLARIGDDAGKFDASRYG